jgi:putative membrane protein
VGVELNVKLKEKIRESLSAVLPITGIVLMLSIFVIPMELGSVVMFLTGALMLIVGMGFFQLGAEMAMTPLGEGVGVQISKMKKLLTVLLTGFLMGVIITVSEPDLQVLAGQVPSVPNMVLIMTVAVGVGLFLALAIVRIRYKISLSMLLIVCYLALILVSMFVPKEFLAVAFDSGGVTTGPMTVPFIMAMGVGLASVRSDKNAANDSFGLVALSSVGPILAVLILGCFFKPTEAAYTLTDVATVVTTQDVARVFAQGLPLYAREVLLSLVPILWVFLIFQWLTHRYHGLQIKRIIVGFGYTYIGLVLFLCGANVGFAPVGAYLGKELAGLSLRWILVPIGALIGYYIVKAEPAIQVLNHQVEAVTNGAISVKMMNRCMQIGVAASVGLAMLRVLTGISIQWFVIPGYIIALVLSRMVPDIFIGIAFDSGGVASGPMTSTFLLPLSIGVCEALGGNLMTDAFGVVALVALTPLIAIQLMGLVYKLKTAKRTQTVPAAIADDCDMIVDLEEGD